MLFPLPNTLRRTFAKMATQLPHLKDIERLSPRVIRILGHNPSKFTLQGTNTYLLGTGPSRILIDTAQGHDAWKQSLSRVLDSEKCTVSTALLTHWHMDHVLGVDDLLSLCPSAQIHKFPLHSAPASFPGYDPAEQEAAYLPLAHGDTFRVPGASLTALHCPGHTQDHVGFVLAEEGGALFAGDNVLGHGTAVFEDLATYLASLRKMGDALGEGARLYPSHGEVVGDGRAKIEEYVAHRRKREEEICKAMVELGGWRRPMEVVKVVYRDYPESLHEPAEGGVRLVLKKLLGEGKVVQEGEKWRLSERSAL